MPVQKELYPYKLKAAMFMGYAYGFGSLLLWTGEKFAPLILIVPHLLQMILVNSPSSQQKLGVYSLQSQQLCMDGIILCALIMCTSLDLSIASKKAKKTTAQK